MNDLSRLVQLLQSPDPHVRAVAAFDLGQQGTVDPEEVVPFLTVALADAHDLVRAFAAQALGDMGVHGERCRRSLEGLAARDPSAQVRTAATQAVRRIRAAVGGKRGDS